MEIQVKQEILRSLNHILIHGFFEISHLYLVSPFSSS